MPTKYPLHEKLRAHEREANVLSGFLDMLDERGLTLGKYHEHDDLCSEGCLRDSLSEYGVPTKAELIGFYLDIDPKALSVEKEAMYAELVAANERREAEGE